LFLSFIVFVWLISPPSRLDVIAQEAFLKLMQLVEIDRLLLD